MFHLPTVNHPARALIDVAHVVEVLAPANTDKLLSTLQARKAAERTFEADKAFLRPQRRVEERMEFRQREGLTASVL